MADPLNDTSPELQRQRQAIHAGLSRVLSAEQANAALQSWPKHYAAGGSVFNGLHAFARDVCLRFNIAGQQRDLVRSLNRALLDASRGKDFSHSEQPALPASADRNKIINPGKHALQSTPIEETAPGEPIETADFQTFQALINALLQLLENSRPGLKPQAIHFLKEVVGSMPWSQAQQQQMLTLLSTGSTLQRRSYQLGQLTLFLQHLRSWMADEMGANVASNALKQAMQETEKTLSGIRYSPINFL